MIHSKDAAKAMAAAINSPDKQTTQRATENDAKVIGLLFKRLKSIFPAWRASFPDEDSEHEARKTWLSALNENGITTAEQIRIGLKKARKHSSPFWPSVGQFISWCELDGEDLGLPSNEEAFKQSVSDGEKHPAVIFSLRKLADPYAYRMSKESDARKAWFRGWSETIRHVANGGEIPEPEKQVEHKVIAAPSHIAESHISKMRKSLRGAL